MEASRHIDYLKKDGVLIVNNHKINSMVTLNGKVEYPKEILEKMSSLVKTITLKASEEALKLGNVKVVNLIMLGALSKILISKPLNWIEAIKESVKPQFLEINLKAFELGASQVK